MRVFSRSLLFTSVAGALMLAGSAYAKHGADDPVVEDVGPRDVPEAPSIDDHGGAVDSAADASDRGGDAGDLGADVGDRGGDAGDRGADAGDHGGDSGDRGADAGDRGGGDRDVADRDVRDHDHGKSTEGGDSKIAEADESRSGSNLSGGGDDSDKSGSNSGSGSSGHDDDTSGSNSGSGSNGSGSDDGGSNSSGDDGSSNSGSGSGNSGSSGDDNSGSGSDSSGSSESSGSGKQGSDDDGDVRFASSGGPAAFETDREGYERRSAEVLFFGSDAQIDAAKSAGYDVLARKALDALGNSIARLRVEDGETIEASLKELRAAAPGAWVDANYGYRPSAGELTATTGKTASAARTMRGKIGVIDTGADAGVENAQINRMRGFASSPYTPRQHGTVVARIVAERGVQMDVADVFEVDAKGGAIASADAIARALDWLVAQGTPVINISIEGPPNKVLEEVIQRAVKAGAIIVAAAGNEGPSAAPAFPAAYPGVVAVTAVDKDGKIYRRANQGDYVAFAALGVKTPVTLGGKVQTVSGTSFASPVVAAEFAPLHKELSPKNAPAALGALRKKAIDKGPKGRDPIYGWGVLSGK